MLRLTVVMEEFSWKKYKNEAGRKVEEEKKHWMYIVIEKRYKVRYACFTHLAWASIDLHAMRETSACSNAINWIAVVGDEKFYDLFSLSFNLNVHNGAM